MFTSWVSPQLHPHSPPSANPLPKEEHWLPWGLTWLPKLALVSGLGCAKGVYGMYLATGHLQRRNSLLTQSGLGTLEGKGATHLRHSYL